MQWPHLYCCEMIKSVANHSSTLPHTCAAQQGSTYHKQLEAGQLSSKANPGGPGGRGAVHRSVASVLAVHRVAGAPLGVVSIGYEKVLGVWDEAHVAHLHLNVSLAWGRLRGLQAQVGTGSPAGSRPKSTKTQARDCPDGSGRMAHLFQIQAALKQGIRRAFACPRSCLVPAGTRIGFEHRQQTSLHTDEQDACL